MAPCIGGNNNLGIVIGARFCAGTISAVRVFIMAFSRKTGCMRVFAISDLHVEHAENDRWVSDISSWDFRNDVLICAGDVAQTERLLGSALQRLRSRFREI